MTSPRPSILRKPPSEMTPGGRAVRNLSHQLSVAVASTSGTSGTSVPGPSGAGPSGSGGGGGGGGGGSPPSSPPRRPDSSGHSSSTISASSSPGEPAGQEGADEPTPSTSAGAGAASSAGAGAGAAAGASGPVPGTATPPLGLSPRKKPRKQNLASTASAAPAASFPAVPFSRPRPARLGSDDEMNFLREHMRTPASSSAASTAAAAAPRPAEPAPPPPKRPAMSLLNSYGPRTWKPASSHFVKYTDVRGRDERRPTIADLASQKHISQKVNGWKIHHISGQLDELAEVERTVHRRLTEMLRASERMSFSRREDKEITKLNELIKGNVQRSKILRDQLSEAKVQITSVFEHKEAIEQAIERYGRKRPTRKRDRR
ncbi:histone deacetylase complex subunit SAP130-like [Amphibalanus amphitrite]|uniref:histone deacetylase complex subunit SAP130-like n=1 Tax=Amphibalanus amphitrite TaxID=1232801 RepID=UPI001C8FACE0|nr:histone deacetylase complex subunit SAP130-like [Amphibalanus amphitrite]